MGTGDYYATLGVTRDATEKDVSAAYRRLARKYHPDVTGGDKDAEERFKQVNEAYEVLSDGEKRTAYDKWGDQWMHAEQLEEMQRQGAFGGASGGPGGFSFTVGDDPFGGTRGQQDPAGFGNIFGRLFRGFGEAPGGPGPVRGRDIEHAVSVSLAEAFHGSTRTIQVQTQGPNGAEVKRLEVKIPAGVENGSRIKLSGKGSPGAGGPPGDLILVISVGLDPRFERRGADLYTDIPVPLSVAVLGGEVEVPTITSRVALRIPQATQNGRTFRLADQGMPVLNAERRGAVLAKVQVVLPEQLSDEQRRLFEQLRDLEPARAGDKDGDERQSA